MADLTKTIEVIFQGVDNISDSFETIGSKLKGFESSVGSVTGPIAGLTSSLLTLEAGIAAAGAAAIAFAVNDSVKFQDALLDFKKVASDLSETELTGLIARVEELSLKYGVAGTDVLNSATNFVQAGYSSADAFKLVEVAATAAVVSELNAAQASEVLIRALAGFGAGASEAGHLLDIFNKVSDSTAASFPELAEGFADIAPIAKTLGLTFEETAAYLVPIIERFGSGSEAATALKTAFSRLVDPTKETRAALDEVGIAQRDASGAFLTGIPLLEAVQSAFKGLTNEQQLYVSAQLVGINQAARFVPILADTEGYQKALTAAMNSGGSAWTEFQKRIESVGFQLQLMGVAFTQMSTKIGDEFSPFIANAANALQELFGTIARLVAEGKLDAFFSSLTPIIDGFTEAVRNVSRNLEAALGYVDFSPFRNALADLGVQLSNLFSGIDLSSPEGLARAIQTVINLISGMIELTAGIASGFKPFVDALASGAENASKMGSDVIKLVGEIMGVATAINAVLPVIGFLGSAITLVGGAFGALSLFKALAIVAEIDTITGAIVALGKALGTAGLITAVGAASYAVTDFLVNTGPGQSVMMGLGDAIDWVTGLADKNAEALGKMSYSAADFATKATTAANATKALGSASQGITQSTEEWANAIAAVTKEFSNAGLVWDSTTGQIKTQADAIAEVAQQAQFAKDAQSGMTKTIVDGVTTYEQFNNALNKTSNATKTATEETDKIKEKMLELASDERIKTMEFAVQLNVAQVEADTARIQAAFDSVNNTINSTGQVISSALGAIGNISGFYGLEQLELIEAQLEKENTYRQQALDMQQDLTDATIAEIEARTATLEKGGGLIQIDAAGLEPEIEAFMFKILKKIQVRANSDASAFLLGLG